VIVVLSFVGGYWPQHKKLVEAQENIAQMSAKLSKAESTVHLCQLQGQLVSLIQEAENENYSDASRLSTKFFDALRSELNTTPPSNLKSSLQSALNQRDAVTAALARGDPKAHNLLMQLLTDLSQGIANKDSTTQPKN
jgi:DNA-binding FadR family transcriptional regulator